MTAPVAQPAIYSFRLFVAGDTPNSTQALRNLSALCKSYLKDRHEIEVIDVLLDPLRALSEGILMTPALVKLSPAPIRKIIGNLSNTQVMIEALELQGDPS